MLDAAGYVDTDADGYRDCTAGSAAVQMGWVPEGTDLAYQMYVRKENPEEKAIAMYLKEQWASVGVCLNDTIVEELTLSQLAYSSNYDTIIWEWNSDVDPSIMLFFQTKAAWGGWSDNRYYDASYDENFSKSVMSMDPADRKTYVCECQRIHYNDSAYIILAYPDSTYVWRDDNITGWGNWTAHPGRSLDNRWSGNPLFFNLEARNVDDGTSHGLFDSWQGYLLVAIVVVVGIAVVATVVYMSRDKVS
jgi:ABC-type transport system substrate-binding protein